jgi:hypothetical protein
LCELDHTYWINFLWRGSRDPPVTGLSCWAPRRRAPKSETVAQQSGNPDEEWTYARNCTVTSPVYAVPATDIAAAAGKQDPVPFPPTSSPSYPNTIWPDVSGLRRLLDGGSRVKRHLVRHSPDSRCVGLKIPQVSCPPSPGARPGKAGGAPFDDPFRSREGGAVIQLGEVVMILDLHRQGLTVSAIARGSGSIARRSASTSNEVWNRRPIVRASRDYVGSRRLRRICASGSSAIPA